MPDISHPDGVTAIAIGPLSVPFHGLPAELGQARSVAWLQDSSWRGRAPSVLLGCGLFQRRPSRRFNAVLKVGRSLRRLKREMERRLTLGEFALGLDPPHLERIPPEESGSDLFRSDGPDAAALSARVESPQSVVQGCSTQGSAVGPGEKEF